MAKKNPPFQKGKIYCIVCFETGRVYIGSTTDYLSGRLGDHKTSWRRNLDGISKAWCSSHDILSSGNYGIFLIEDFPCECRKELTGREAYWINMYGHSAVNRMLHSHQN
jgi:hypothetical protein